MNDDDLLAQLKAADPALTSSAPLPDNNRLVEAALTIDTTTQPANSASGTPRSATNVARGRRLVLAAAAAVLLAGGGITWGVLADNDQSKPLGKNQPSTRAVLALTAGGIGPDAGAAKCMEPTVDLLRTFPVAFEGTVTSKGSHQVEFRIDHWFRGGDAATARIASDEKEQWSEAQVFEAGQRYLVTAEDGVVPVCGGTSQATQEAEDLFNQAFEK